MYTGSMTENRISICVPAGVRQIYLDESARLGMKPTELMRHDLLRAAEVRQQAAQAAGLAGRGAEIARDVAGAHR
jgi:hypothetical protein